MTKFRSISEASDELGVPASRLRFWEEKFPRLKPLRYGGRRCYRQEHIDFLKWIRTKIDDEGYTTRGVQKLIAKRAPHSYIK